MAHSFFSVQNYIHCHQKQLSFNVRVDNSFNHKVDEIYLKIGHLWSWSMNSPSHLEHLVNLTDVPLTLYNVLLGVRHWMHRNESRPSSFPFWHTSLFSLSFFISINFAEKLFMHYVSLTKLLSFWSWHQCDCDCQLLTQLLLWIEGRFQVVWVVWSCGLCIVELELGTIDHRTCYVSRV